METKEENKQKEAAPEAVQFNIGQDQLNIIASLLRRADTHRMNGNMSGWFDDLMGIKLMVVSKLGQSVRDELEKKERFIRYTLSKRNKSDFADVDGVIIKYNNKLDSILGKYLREYQTRLMELMDERDYLIPTKQSRTNLFDRVDPDEKEK